MKNFLDYFNEIKCFSSLFNALSAFSKSKKNSQGHNNKLTNEFEKKYKR